MALSEYEAADTMSEHIPYSLYDAIVEQNRALNKKTLIHRIIIISKMYHNNFVEIGQYYDRLYKAIHSLLVCEPITGLLLLFPKHCVHVLEGGMDVLLEMVKDLQRQADAEEGHMEISRILVNSHNIPNKQFKNWSYRIIDVESPSVDLYEPSETTDKLVIDIITQVLRLSNFIVRQQPKANKSMVDNLHDKVPDLLPQQVVIGWVIENDYDDVTIPTKEFLTLYSKPYDVVLAGDLVWPMPARLFPYQ